MLKKQVSRQYKRKVKMEATILEVINPGHFVVRETPNKAMSYEARMFVEMEQKLNQYYCSLEIAYSLMPERDAVIAVLPDGETKWYRARVISIVETTHGPSVHCYLLDYGGRRLISRERMYKLTGEFLFVPFQAVDFILLGIKPMAMNMYVESAIRVTQGPAKDWDFASKQYVETVVQRSDAAFVIEILGSDFDGCVYGNLYIDDDRQKICLNEELVAQKYAYLDETAHENVHRFGVFDLMPPESSCVDQAPTSPSILSGKCLAEFSDVENLSIKELKSLRRCLESTCKDAKVLCQQLNDKSSTPSEVKPKVCPMKQFQAIRNAIARSRPCSRAQHQDVEMPSSITSSENASVGHCVARQPQREVANRVRSFYRRSSAASRVHFAVPSTAAQPKANVSQASPEERDSSKHISPNASFSSCSVPLGSSDDDLTSGNPSTPFPVYNSSVVLQHSSSNSESRLSQSKTPTSQYSFRKKVNDLGLHFSNISSNVNESKELSSRKTSLDNHPSSSDKLDTYASTRNSHISPNFTGSCHENENSCCQRLGTSSANISNRVSQRSRSSSVSTSSNLPCSVRSMAKFVFNENCNSQICAVDVGNASSAVSSGSPTTSVSTVCSGSPTASVSTVCLGSPTPVCSENSSRASVKKFDPIALRSRISRFQKHSCSVSLSNRSQVSQETSSSPTCDVKSEELNCGYDSNSHLKSLKPISSTQKVKLPQLGRLTPARWHSSVARGLSTRVFPETGSLSQSSLESEEMNSLVNRNIEMHSPSDKASSVQGSLSSNTEDNSVPGEVSPDKTLCVPSRPSMEACSTDKVTSDANQMCPSVDVSCLNENVSCTPQLFHTNRSHLTEHPKTPPAADFHHHDERLLLFTKEALLCEEGTSNGPDRFVLQEKEKMSCDKMSCNLQNEPSPCQEVFKKVSVDELFLGFKEQETRSLTPSRPFHQKQSPNKMLERVRSRLANVRKDILRPVSEVLQCRQEDEFNCSPTASAHHRANSDSDVNSKETEAAVDPQKSDVTHSFPSKIENEISPCVGGYDSIKTNRSNTESYSDAAAILPTQCDLKEGSPARPQLQTGNMEHTKQPPQVIENNKTQILIEGSGRDLLSSNTENLVSQFNLNGDVPVLVNERSDMSDDSSDDEKDARIMPLSVVQSLTQQIPDMTNQFCREYFKTTMDFSDRSLWEAITIPAVTLGDCAPKPLQRTEEVPFSPPIKKKLEEFKFWGPSCIQSVVWPTVFRNRSFAAIAPPTSGKTLSYLLPILSMLADGTKYQDLPSSNGPILLILCSNWVKVLAAYDQCLKFLDGLPKIKVKVLYGGGGDRDQEVNLFNGCDILIATPPSFLYYLNKKVTNFERCLHFCLDDGNHLIEKYKEEISSIMKDLHAHIKRHQNLSNFLQISICTEKWTKGVAAFVETFLLKPLLFFTSFLEAAVYAHLPTYVTLCNSRTIDRLLMGLIENLIVPKTVICTRDIATAMHVQDVMQRNSIFSILAHERKLHFEMTAIKRHWNAHHTRDSNFILVATDRALDTLNVRDANCIFHYDLPEVSKFTFSRRFGCFADYICAKPKQEHLPCLCHILLSEDCRVQAPTLAKLMNRMGLECPKQLLWFASEQRKISSNRPDAPLCMSVKAFGECKDSKCKQRHTISKELDSPFVNPTQGDIKALVTHVIDATHYYVRILEYTDAVSLSKTVVSAQYTKLFVQLKDHYNQPVNKVCAEAVEKGGVYAIEDPADVYHRVQVTEIIRFEGLGINDIIKVKVFFLDDGSLKDKRPKELLILPEDLKSQPQMCVEAFLCNVKTVDFCNQWTPQASMFVSKLISGQEIHGKIVLCLGETIWLNPLFMKEGNAVKFRLDKTLKRLSLASPNMEHLNLLYKMCADKIDLPMDTVPEKSAKKDISQPTADHAFLDLGSYEDVYVNDVITPQQFFVQRVKFYDCLEALNKEIENLQKNMKLKKVHSVEKGMYCIAIFPDDKKFYRAVVEDLEETGMEVNLFFVDYGESVTVQRSDLYCMPPKLLHVLPFQAIECELAGVVASEGEWSMKAGDTLYDFTREKKDGLLKILSAKVFQKTSRSNGGNLFTVLLFDGSVNIAEHLVKMSLAAATELPAFPNEDKEAVAELDDIASGYFSGSDGSAEVDEPGLNFVAAYLGLYTPETNPPKSVEQSQAVCRSNSSVTEVTTEPSPPSDQQVTKDMSQKLKPPMTWWDSPKQVFLSIKLPDVKTFELLPFVDGEGFSFSTQLNDKNYFIELILFAEVFPEETVVSCQGQEVRVIFNKRNPKMWPRLTQQTEKLYYIQRNMDHLDSESESERNESAGLVRIPVEKEDIYHMCTTAESGSSGDSDFGDSSWKRMSQPKDV